VARADAAAALPFRAAFDRILLDAPCSGLGTLRRDPDIKWRRQADDLPVLAAAQAAMLERAAAVLKPGGTLVYATCSSEPEEDDDVVRRFLDRSPGFRLSPESADPWSTRFFDADGYFRTLPPRDGLEAFFAAILVKTKDLH
jgi:16S rRNA (cytosine967-C5)-methyltransferase